MNYYQITIFVLNFIHTCQRSNLFAYCNDDCRPRNPTIARSTHYYRCPKLTEKKPSMHSCNHAIFYFYLYKKRKSFRESTWSFFPEVCSSDRLFRFKLGLLRLGIDPLPLSLSIEVDLKYQQEQKKIETSHDEMFTWSNYAPFAKFLSLWEITLVNSFLWFVKLLRYLHELADRVFEFLRSSC